MSVAQDTDRVVKEYGDHIAAGEYDEAQAEAGRLTNMDCDVCQRVGVMLGGLALAAQASFSEEAEQMIVRVALSRADGLADRLTDKPADT